MTLVGTVWKPIGPSPIASGRDDNGLISAIAINPNDPDIVYMGSAGGGVWRSRDGGTNWRPLFDRQIALGIGEPAAIAIDPADSDTLYIGTSQRLTPQAPAGLYKSTDGGASCVRLGSGYPAGNVGNATQFFSQWINAVRVDPANSAIVYLASSSGVFRSTDGGLNWRPGTGLAGDTMSLVLDPTSSAAARVLYAGVSGSGVFRSVNGGQSWTPILSTATAAVAGVLAGGGITRVVVDLAPPTSPPNPSGIQVLYASTGGSGTAPDPVGLFMSTDAGATWSARAATGMPGNTQGGYSFHFAVDPASPGDGSKDILFFGAVGQAWSKNSGASFTAIPNVHADTHAWAFVRRAPGTPSTVYVGCDGGVFRSDDAARTAWSSRNKGGLQTGLFYNLTVKPDATASVTLGALQDNGILTTAGPTSPQWNDPQGGDGWDVAYDGGTAGRVYGTSGFWGPNPPCTRLFFSNVDGADFSPTAQRDITPWGATTDQGCYLAPVSTDPGRAGVVYVGGNQNLWQTRDGGISWRILTALSTAIVAVAPTNGNNVAAAVGGQVWLSTNALALTVGAPTGVTFTNITRNLPGRNVLRVAFDPNDPTAVFAVLGGFSGFLGGHVYRTTVAGTAWADISPPLDVPFGGLALDGTDTPSTIYVGTDLGVLRSVDRGQFWTVLDDLRFPQAPVSDMVLSQPAGVLRVATYGRGVFEFSKPNGPAITVDPENALAFGHLCVGDSAHLTLRVFNIGTNDLVINSVQRLTGSTAISVLALPGTPVVVQPGEDVTFSVRYTPTTQATTDITTIRIVSNDPQAPVVDLAATGTSGAPALDAIVFDHGDYGEVCLGAFSDKYITLVNSGDCPLTVSGISSSAAAFVVPTTFAPPFTLGAGDAVELPIRYQPTTRGAAAATITIASNDPASPKAVRLTGSCPPPRLVLAVPDSGSYGNVCVDTFHDQPLTIANAGHCDLTVTGLSVSSPEFLLPGVANLPVTVEPASAIELTVRFAPRSYGPKNATLTVISDDPTSPATVALSGNAPPPILRVTGTTHFGPVDFGLRAHETLSINNVGPCDLHVTKVAFLPQPCCPDCDGCGDTGQHHDPEHNQNDQRCTDFCLVNNPFPATVRPGTNLGILIQYTPSCDGARCCELVIESDDPATPVKKLIVTGHLHRTLSAALKCWASSEIHELWNAGRRRC